ncbi:MAG: hypothetical protein IPJ73_18660 [Zoogloea sp.]|nr:hypothetical protein [Zoogloea sp.]
MSSDLERAEQAARMQAEREQRMKEEAERRAEMEEQRRVQERLARERARWRRIAGGIAGTRVARITTLRPTLGATHAAAARGVLSLRTAARGPAFRDNPA